MPDNIMLDAGGKPVNVPGVVDQKLVVDSNGAPVVPVGTEQPLNQAPKDTLPRPSVQQIPVQQVPVTKQETIQSNAVEGAITFEELAVKKGFKSPDDLAKSYVNLESQTKRVEATLTDAIDARIQTNPEEKIEPQAGNIDADQDALKIVDARITNKMRTMEDTMDYKLHLIQTPGDQQYAVEAIKVVKENPGIKWSTAFDAARARMNKTVTQNARQEGANEAYAKIEQKQDAQVLEGSQNRPGAFNVQSKEVVDGIKTGKIPLSEARNIINVLSKDLRK